MKKTICFLAVSAGVFAAVLIGGAYLVLELERGADGATIRTISDALWWTVNISSVGDANMAPVTDAGRFAGAMLILIGYALFTVNVGLISAVFTHVIKHERERRV